VPNREGSRGHPARPLRPFLHLGAFPPPVLRCPWPRLGDQGGDGIDHVRQASAGLRNLKLEVADSPAGEAESFVNSDQPAGEVRLPPERGIRHVQGLEQPAGFLRAFGVQLVEGLVGFLAEQGLAASLVQDPEIHVHAGRNGIFPQQPGAKAVDRGDVGAFDLLPARRVAPKLGHQALLDVGGGLFGERNGQNTVGRDLLLPDQPAEALRQYARLAGTRPGHHANILPKTLGGSFLGRVQEDRFPAASGAGAHADPPPDRAAGTAISTRQTSRHAHHSHLAGSAGAGSIRPSRI